jgi:hypothetical protein
MATVLEDLALEVLEHGLDDWLYLAEVEYTIRDRLQSEPAEDSKKTCFALLEYLLANQLSELGDLKSVGGEVRFVPWGLDIEASLNKVERRWARYGGPRDESGANDVCWLSNTEAGNQVARRASG